MHDVIVQVGSEKLFDRADDLLERNVHFRINWQLTKQSVAFHLAKLRCYQFAHLPEFQSLTLILFATFVRAHASWFDWSTAFFLEFGLKTHNEVEFGFVKHKMLLDDLVQAMDYMYWVAHDFLVTQAA